MNNTNFKTWLAGLCAATLLFLATPAWAGQGGDGGGGGHRGQRGQRLAQFEQRINERLQKLQERLAAHPNAPAAVKTAADKLIADLKDAEGDIEKIKAALAAHDKATLQGMKGELKKDHEAIKADREALREAVQAAVKDIRGVLPQGHRGGHGGGQDQKTVGA